MLIGRPGLGPGPAAGGPCAGVRARPTLCRCAADHQLGQDWTWGARQDLAARQGQDYCSPDRPELGADPRARGNASPSGTWRPGVIIGRRYDILSRKAGECRCTDSAISRPSWRLWKGAVKRLPRANCVGRCSRSIGPYLPLSAPSGSNWSGVQPGNPARPRPVAPFINGSNLRFRRSRPRGSMPPIGAPNRRA